MIEDREDVDKDSDMWIVISHNEQRIYVNQRSAGLAMSRKHNKNGAYALGICAVCPRADSNWGIRVWPGGVGDIRDSGQPRRARI